MEKELEGLSLQRPEGGAPEAKGKRTYLAETGDGFLTRVPEDKLGSWQEEQAGPAVPMNRAEQLLKDKIMQRIYGGRR